MSETHLLLVFATATAMILVLPQGEFPTIRFNRVEIAKRVTRRLPRLRHRSDLTQRNFLLLSGLRAELVGGSTAQHALQYLVSSEFSHDLPKTHSAVESFGNISRALVDDAELSQMSGLNQLAVAWELSEDTGAPLAELIEQIIEAIDRDEKSRALIQTGTAGVKATVFVLALLPVIGMFLAAMLGINVLSWFFSGVIGVTCLFLGSLLEIAGVLWVRKMIAGAAPQISKQK